MTKCVCEKRFVSNGRMSSVRCPVCNRMLKVLGSEIVETKIGVFNHWLPLHKYAPEHGSDWDSAKAEKWYNLIWLPKVPSVGCSCKSHWSELTQKYPPDFSSAKAFFEWSCARHNDVSRLHSHKPQITLEEAYKLYWAEP